MKKRVLSALLALTLCFTLFVSSSFAAVSIGSGLGQIDNAFVNKAANAGANAENSPTQQDAINAAVENLRAVFEGNTALRAEIMENLISTPDDEAANAIITKEMLKITYKTDESGKEVVDTDNNDMLCYFILRMLSDGAEVNDDAITYSDGKDSISRAEYEKLYDLVVEFVDVDADDNPEYSIADKGPKESLDRFDKYSDRLKELYGMFMDDAECRAEIYDYLGINEADENDALEEMFKKSQAYTCDQAADIVEYILLDVIIFSSFGDNRPYTSAYNDIMGNDDLKKNAAILVGKGLLDFANSGLRSVVTEYFKARKSVYVELVAGKKAGLLDADVDVVIETAFDLADEMLAQIKADMTAADLSENVRGKMAEAVEELANRGLSLDGILGTAKYLVGALSADKVGETAIEDFISVWYDLGLGFVVKLTKTGNSSEADENGKFMATLDVKVDHNFINRRFPSLTDEVKNLSANVYVTFADTNTNTSGDKKIENYVDSYSLDILYTPTEEDQKVKLNVYRGEDAVNGWDVERYIGQFTVTLNKKPAKPPVEHSVKITEATKAKIEDNYKYVPGEEIVIAMDVNNVDLVVLGVHKKDTDNKGNILYVTLTKEQAEAGYRFNAPAEGIYEVFVGNSAFVDADGNAIATDSSWFVVEKQDEPVVKTKLLKEYYPNDGKSNIKTSANRGTELEKIPALNGNGRLANVGFKDENGKVVELTLPITWTGYDKDLRTEQTLDGTYDVDAIIAAGYELAEGNDIDGKVNAIVTRPSNPTTDRYPNDPDNTHFTDGTGYDGNKTIHLVGVTNNTKVAIDLVDPNGKVIKTVILTRAEFTNGFDWDVADLVPLADGLYTLVLRSTTGTGDPYDKRTFTVGSGVIDIKIFTEDHVNYIIGFEDGTVRPEATITRDEVAAILFRLLKDEYRTLWLTRSTDKFTDLAEDRWSMTAFATLNTAGIFLGRGDGTIGAGDDITRAEFAALASRFAIRDVEDLPNPYSDITGNWAEKEIKAVTAAGWFQGDDTGSFRPNDKMTRAEVVTVINRILGRDKVDLSTFKDIELVSFSDLTDENAWFYTAMVEATNAHGHTFDANDREVWTAEEDEVDWTIYE